MGNLSDYDELVKRLKNAAQWADIGLVITPSICLEAADAIERLAKDLERSKEYETFWEKEANEALKKFQTTVASIPRWIPVTERLPIGGDDSGAVCENVCLMMDDGTVSCGWMNGITKKVYYLNARDDVIIKAPITRVTHWMPLPSAPMIDGRVVVTDTRGRERETTVRNILEMNKGVYTAADVRPVVKAKWVYTDMSRLVCSNCGNPVAFALKDNGWHHGDFCPQCGARMEES